MSSQLPTPPREPGSTGGLNQAEPTDLSSPAPLEFEGVESGDALNWRRYLSALYRYKWLIVLITLIGSAAGFAASMFIKPVYMAQASIWLERAGGERATAAQPIQARELFESAGWADLMRSYAVLDGVVREQRLFVQPASPRDAQLFESFAIDGNLRPGHYRLVVDDEGEAYILETRAGEEVERGAVGAPIGQPAGFRWQIPSTELQPGRRVEFEVSRPRDAAVRLGSDLRATLDRGGNFLRISLTGTDPTQIAAIVNSVSERFVELAAELKRDKVDELEAILGQQLSHSEEYLRNAEIALENFRVQTITLPTEDDGPYAPGLDMTRTSVFGRFFDKKLEQEALRQDRQAIQRIIAQVRQGSEVPVLALELIGSVSASSELRPLLGQLTTLRAELRAARRRYTDEHPDVRALVAEIESLERQTIPELAENVIRNIASREADLDNLVETASGELREIPPRVSDEARLRRHVATAENLYTTLRRRYEEARLASLTTISGMRVLDYATEPRWPVSDERNRLILFAFLGSLSLGLVGAIALDRVDPRLRYPEQVTQLGLVTLGAVPHVGNGNRRGMHAAAGSDQRLIEAFRGIRLNVTYAYGSAGPVLLTVSSPGPGDGKSFISANLALAFAHAGHRTLLIDGDIRRGVLHQLFERPRKPGLTDFLRGDAGWDDVVQATPHSSLSIVGSGTRHQSAPESLGAPAMGELLSGALQAKYGVILVDSPPLGSGVDPLVLATWTRNLVVVLRSGNTNRELTGVKLDLVNRLPIRLLGAVLNDVPLTGVYRYYSYESGYEIATETQIPAGQLRG